MTAKQFYFTFDVNQMQTQNTWLISHVTELPFNIVSKNTQEKEIINLPLNSNIQETDP